MTTVTPPPPPAGSDQLPPGSPLPPPGGDPAGAAGAPAPRLSGTTRRALTVVGVAVAFVAALQVGLLAVDLMARRDRVETFSFAGGVEVLRIDSDHGGVRVVGGDRTDIAVRAEIREGLADADVEVEQVGDDLRFDTSCGPVFLPSTCSVTFVVEVPRSIGATIDSAAGGIRVEGVDGPLDLDSSAGGVRLVDVSGTVKAHSSAGEVRGDRLRSTAVEADSSAGGVRLSFVVAPDAVLAKSSAGGVTVEVPRDDNAYRVDASSSAGSEDVEVATDPRSDRVITARSSAGSVRIRYGE